jgi:hypothetical protein
MNSVWLVVFMLERMQSRCDGNVAGRIVRQLIATFNAFVPRPHGRGYDESILRTLD